MIGKRGSLAQWMGSGQAEQSYTQRQEGDGTDTNMASAPTISVAALTLTAGGAHAGAPISSPSSQQSQFKHSYLRYMGTYLYRPTSIYL